MNFQSLRFLTDENIDVEVLEFIRNHGCDVVDIKERLMWGLGDREILELAHAESRVVVSQDSDFGTLIFKEGADFFGVIYLRPGHVSPELHVESIRAVIEANIEFMAPFLLVVENKNGFVKLRLRVIT